MTTFNSKYGMLEVESLIQTLPESEQDQLRDAPAFMRDLALKQIATQVVDDERKALENIDSGRIQDLLVCRDMVTVNGKREHESKDGTVSEKPTFPRGSCPRPAREHVRQAFKALATSVLGEESAAWRAFTAKALERDSEVHSISPPTVPFGAGIGTCKRYLFADDPYGFIGAGITELERQRAKDEAEAAAQSKSADAAKTKASKDTDSKVKRSRKAS